MTNPLERRDWFVDAAARRLQSAGVPVPVDALRRQTAEDLRLVDQATAAGDLRRVKASRKLTPAEVIALKESKKADALARAEGASLRRRQLPTADKPKRLRPLKGVDAQRTFAMAARLRLIGTRSGLRLRAGTDMEHGFEYARLAREAAEETTNHDARRGPYMGVSARDRDRILYRRLQDICDRSDSVVGFNWWVK